MVSQIAEENEEGEDHQAVDAEPSTADETNIDALFERYEHDILCDLSLKERAPDAV